MPYADPQRLKQYLVPDHDHVTGAFRAVLCNFCNPMLGYSRDEPLVLEAAMAYLEAH